MDVKTITVRFEPDPALNHIDVLIRAPEQDEEVAALMEKLSGGRPEQLPVFDRNGCLHVISPDDIILASVEGKIVTVITENGSWHMRRTLQSLEAELDSERFARISRYELVNLNKVQHYDFSVSGTLRMELAGGMETWVARRCIPALRRRLLRKE